LVGTDVHRLHLTDVTPSPDLPWARPTFPVFGYLVLHPAGPIVVDTGVGVGHPWIDEMYGPEHHDLDAALARHGVQVGDVAVVVSSHLHFDHCGHNHRFEAARILVQQAEVEAARAPSYTVAEWAFPPNIEVVAVDGEHEVAPGVHVVPTPGHTPGHQSVVVADPEGGAPTVICAQASWDRDSFDAGTIGDEHADDTAVGEASVGRLHALAPSRVLFSHDPRAWTPVD
jgi:glyoxylase-like metal-dependent hydrolase (beta-lactamase superfamily II)